MPRGSSATALRGVEGVYDGISYRDEKADALRRLATLIDGIEHPRVNVVPLDKALFVKLATGDWTGLQRAQQTCLILHAIRR